jgi:DNA-binding SARP family transcriptional activator/tetratricopeptide (TPR) repeat protein
MEFRLLGEVQLRAGGLLLNVGAARQQAVLAALAVDAGRPVGIETLVDRVWDDNPPVQARNVLYSHLSRLRRLLRQASAAAGEPVVRVERRHAGYVLDVAPELVDAHRFRRLVEQGRDPHHGDAERAEVLAEALALWRGTPLVSLAGAWVRQARDSWHRSRLDAVVQWAQLELRLGHPAVVISALPDLIAEYPLVEPLEGLLMRALQAVGRDAEALDRYTAIRQRLVDDLGTDPGAELRELHQVILRGEPPLLPPPTPVVASARTVPSPAQLPADTPMFTGRDTELHHLDRLLAATSNQPTAVVISAVSGTAGIGKTALAVHWAHRVADRFPDGQLHVNLRGFDPGGQIMEPAAAIRGFLDALDVPPQRIPADIDAQTALYRSLLAGKRVLVLIDNARDAAHARPLLPGTGTALAIVTSRNLLTDLIADGAHPLALDLLTREESRELLERRLGPGRVAAEPDAVKDIIRECTRLPLALALVAARAATHPSFPLAAVATELANATGQPTLDDSDDVIGRVRAVFSWSYTTLTPSAARLFRLLGLHPGPDTSAPAAASLAGLPLAQVRRLLAELSRAGLLTEHLPGRYTFHDLLRDYATGLTHTHDRTAVRREAITRLLDHYLHTAHTADRHLDPARNPIILPLPVLAPGTVVEHFTSRMQAMTWLTTERLPLLAAAAHAAGTGFDTYTWHLAWVLDNFLYLRGHWHDRAVAWRAAVDAAKRLADPIAQAYAHRLLAQADIRLDRYPDAYHQLRRALALYTDTGDRAGQAHTYHCLDWYWERQGALEQALECARQSLDLFRALGNQRGQAWAVATVGWRHAQLGDYEQALAHCHQALPIFQQIDDNGGEANVWDGMGYVHQHLAHHRQAIDCFQHAADLYRDYGDRYGEGSALDHLGNAYNDAGNLTAARTTWQHALDILTDLDHSDTETVRAKLTSLDRRPPTQ